MIATRFLLLFLIAILLLVVVAIAPTGLAIIASIAELLVLAAILRLLKTQKIEHQRLTELEEPHHSNRR
jgi:uncharacterized membrane protein YqjE